MIRNILAFVRSLFSKSQDAGVDLNEQEGVVDGPEDLKDVEVRVKKLSGPEQQEPKIGITDEAFMQAATEIGAEPAHVRAVDEVESRGQGFLSDGRPKILFEAHWFGKLTSGKYHDAHPDISSPKWDRSLYKGGVAEHDRIQRAMELNRKAALQSASWGRYQIMGFNWDACGYSDLQSFIDGMWKSESEHLRAFVGFVQSKGLADPLRKGDWDAFARGYNGPGYKKNNYAQRMREAYERFRAKSS